MTYKDHFVVEVKCNGKILRVKDGAVYLPFGSEYTLLLKNLNSKKASVKVHIDGQDVLDYSSLIIGGNGQAELEGVLSGTTARNKFKFIHKTKEIQEHRGDKADDGMIRVEFAFEKIRPKTVVHDHHEHHHHHHHHDYDYYRWWPYTYTRGPVKCYNSPNNNDTVRYASATGEKSNIMETQTFNASADVSQIAAKGTEVDSLGVESLGAPLDDEGITVKGSECYQSFRYGSVGELEQSEVIIIQLKGLAQTGTTIEKPVTVKTKLECPTCGTKSKSSFKFCPDCGTFLE